MKRNCLSLLLLLAWLTLGISPVLASPLIVVTAPGVTALPQAAPPTARYDFGVRQASDSPPIAQTFTLRNSGPSPVTLTRIEPSCGCTTAVLSGTQTLPVTIGAGQAVAISVSVNPGHVAPGAVRKTVWVYTADADRPAALLEIVGTINSDDTPSGLHVGDLAPALPSAALRRQPTALFFFCGCPQCNEVARQWGKAQRGGRLASGDQTVIVFAGDKAAANVFAVKNGLELSRMHLIPDPASKLTEDVYQVVACPRVFVVFPSGAICYTNDKPNTSAGAIVSHSLVSLAAMQSIAPH